MDPTDPRWTAIDELLFDRLVLPAAQAFRDQTGLALSYAIAAIDDRVGILMRTRSGEFRVPLEGYGDGVYT